MKPKISPKQALSVSRISGLVVSNAMIFQEVLSEDSDRIEPVQRTVERDNVIGSLCKHWKYILEEINYYPIFHLAREIIADLGSSPDVIRALRTLAENAQRIVSMRAALRHDLMGRVYHKLLADAKYLGTYYTSIPAATLLLKLALRMEDWNIQWNDLDRLAEFRVVDLACGTGTLLMAAADAITDNYIRLTAHLGFEVDRPALHKVMLENTLFGFDVLPSAAHLTASSLALREPEVELRTMNLFSLPLGGQQNSLGSIEFFEKPRLDLQYDLFRPSGESHQLTGNKKNDIAALLPNIDLCVMNPPFTRSVGGNLLFGSVEGAERSKMQSKLKKMLNKSNSLASITAGLGSVFVAVADTRIKAGGRIALVLPKALLSGVAWNKTRELLRRKYQVEYIVSSHDPLRWNFSESTSLSEILLVAVKNGNNSDHRGKHVNFINLWRNPDTSFENLSVAQSVKDDAPDISKGQGAIHIAIGGEKIGEAVSLSWEELKEQSSWMLSGAFAQSDLVRAAYHLMRGSLWIPGQKRKKRIKLCRLGELGSLGPDRRDIHDGFLLSGVKTAYPAFWGHDSRSVLSMDQQPNAHLSPLPRGKKGRPLRKVEDLWPLAGGLLIAERLRLNTQRLSAVRMTVPVLSNMWWPVSMKIRGKRNKESFEKILAAWMNSTLGLLLLLVSRQETEGAWIDFKKPSLMDMPVLDPREMPPNKIKELVSAFDALAEKTLLSLPEIRIDETRAEIDKRICKALNLPDIEIYRNLLAQEPVVCLNPLYKIK